MISLMYGAGASLLTGCVVGVTLDLGVESTGKRLVLSYTSSANTTQITFHARASDYPANDAWATTSTWDDAFTTTVTAAGAAGTSAGTFTTARRYIQLFLVNDSFTGTISNDIWFSISACMVAASTAFESSNVSVLKASTVVSDALARGTTLLSSGTDRITTTTFNIPSLSLDGYKTPRQVIDGVNSYHDYNTQIDVDKKMVFEAKPTAPVLEVGNWSGAEFEDASMNDGSEIYNAVVVQAEGPDGSQLNVRRRQPTSTLETTTVTTPAPDNPSFATNTSNWTTTYGTLTRTTTAGEFDSGSSGGKLVQTSIGSAYVGVTSGSFTGTFQGGRTYTLTLRARTSATPLTGSFELRFGVVSGSDYGSLYLGSSASLSTSFQTFTITWTPRTTVTSNVALLLRFYYVSGSAGTLFFDTLSLSTTVSTLADRRGFQRTKILPVSSALTADAANQIGDVWLAGHKTTPFKGTLKVTGNSVRRVLGGEAVPPHKLLTMTGQKIRFSNRIDPDTGGWGRDGEIAAVSYDYDANTATIDVDNQRGNFDALLSRLAIIQGG